MKFGQLIECNMRNIFVEKPYTKCEGEIFPDPYLKEREYLWIDSVSFKQFVSIVY